MSPNNPFSDVVDSAVPSIASVPEDTQPSEGFLKTAVKTIIRPVSNLAKDIAYGVSSDIRQGAASLKDLEKTNPRLAAEMKAEQDRSLIGFQTEKPTFGRVAGDIAGTALLAAPVWEIKALKELPVLATLVRGGAYGAGFGAADALSEGKSLSQAVEQGIKTAPFGAVLEFGGGLAMKGIGAGAKFALKGAYQKVADKFPNLLTSLETRLRSNFGEVGNRIADGFLSIDRNQRNRFGQASLEMMDAGILEKPRLFPWQPKNEVMTREQAWAGDNSLLDQLKGQTKGNGEAYDVANNLRAMIKSEAESTGVRDQFLNPETYFPQHTPETFQVKLSDKERAAGNILGPEDSMRRDVIENAVYKDHTFATPEEAAKVLDGWVEFVEGGGRVIPGNAWLEHMVAKGQASTINEAAGKTIREMQFRKDFLTQRAGSLDHAREYDFPFYDPDPRRVLPLYTYESLGRLESARTFGAKDEKLKELIGQVQQMPDLGFNKATEVENIIRQITGQIDRSPERAKLSKWLRTLNVMKLSFSQIINLGQNLNNLLASDLSSLGTGLSKAFSDTGVREAIQSGALVNNVMQHSLSYAGGGTTFANNWLKWTGFQWTELFNRTVAANTGIKYAERVFNKLQKNPNDARLLWQLDELNIDTTKALEAGKIDSQELIRAGDVFSEKTQFLSRNIDLPGFASSPEGKVVFQFKNFAYQQARFIKNEIKLLARSGNYTRIARDLLIIGTVFPMTGEVLGDIRSLVTQEKRPTKALDRYLADISSAGTFGLVFDIFNSAKYGKLLESAVGPTPSAISDLVQGAIQSTLKGKLTPGFEKTVLRQTGLGQIPGNIFFPTKDKSRQSILDFFEGL